MFLVVFLPQDYAVSNFHTRSMSRRFHVPVNLKKKTFQRTFSPRNFFLKFHAFYTHYKNIET